jgi:uncharacterized protein
VIPAHLSLITLGVSDLARSEAFYQSLGWQATGEPGETISFIRLNGVVLGLYGHNALADDVGVDSARSGFRGVTMAINFATPERVDEVVAAWHAAGATVVKQPQAVEWGGYSGYVADPDGHLWEIAFNPFSPEWAAPE